MDRGVDTTTKQSDTIGHRIYGLRFVNSIKNKVNPNGFENLGWLFRHAAIPTMGTLRTRLQVRFFSEAALGTLYNG